MSHSSRSVFVRLAALLPWVALLAGSALAQEHAEPDVLPAPAHLRGSIQFEQLSLADGLSQSSVFDIMQDSRGFMWFATQDGLNRYDGHEFKVYKRTPFDSASFNANWIWSISEAPDGSIWTGTQSGGVSRLDPVTEDVQTFRHDPNDLATLSDDFVFDVLADDDGIIWAATRAGLDRLDPSTGDLIRYTHDTGDATSLSDSFAVDVFADESGTIWVGTSNGLNRLDPESNEFERFFYNPDRVDDGRIPRNMIPHMVEVPEKDELWMTSGSGILKLDKTTGEIDVFIDDAGRFSRLVHIARDPKLEGVFWATSDDGHGLVRLDSRSGNFTNFEHDPADPHSISSNDVFALFTDRSGMMWVGAAVAAGVARFDPSSGGFINFKHRPGDSASLHHRSVWGLYVAPSEPEVIWARMQEDAAWTRERLNKIDQRTGEVTHFVHDPANPSSIGSGRIVDMHEDHLGQFWIATSGGGLNLMDRSSGTFTRFVPEEGNAESISHDEVTTIFEASDGNLWLGTDDGDVNKMDPRRPGYFTRFIHASEDSGTVAGNLVLPRRIAEDRRGILWVGGSEGLSRIDSERGVIARYELAATDARGLQGDDVRQVFVDGLDQVWVVTRSNSTDVLSRLDREAETFKQYVHDPTDSNSLSDFRIEVIHERPSEPGILWLGSPAGGLTRFDTQTESFKHFLESDGLPNNFVYGILEDEEGKLWLSTNNGLARFDPETESFRNFDENHGLQSREFNSGAFFASSTGQLVFGGIDGVTAFYPQELRPNLIPPMVMLTDFRLFNRSIEPGEESVLAAPLSETKEIRLRHWQKTLTFGFVGLHFVHPEKNQYQYQLEGFDEDWVSAGTRREATYTNLDPGEYTFRVRAANSDGIWSDEAASMALMIAPPFWNTWWFRFLLVAGIFGLAISLFRARVRSIRERNRILEAQVAERTDELRGKNEQLEKSHAIVQAINQETGLESLLTSVLEQTRVIGGVEKASALVYDDGIGAFLVKASMGWSREQVAPIRLTEEEAHARYVEHAEEVAPDIFLERNVAERPDHTAIGELGMPASLLVMRVRSDGRTEGYIVFDNMHDRNAFDRRDVDLLISLRAHIQSAFGKTRLLEDLQRSIENLKAAQAQLVQSEKMASLGQLTAGIAHEIKNPLNFINNFAGLITELADELEDGILRNRQNLGDDAEEISEILNDLRLNASKINDHGRRADGIVKSMLQHSRDTAGEREDIDINALLDEYVNLAYHGMRAQKIDFNATIERRFGADVGRVDAMPQEIGRVFINLLNNAFYAVHEKAHKAEENYMPTVEIKTARQNGTVEICIADNGPGIPEHVRRRIFEPFYTTKPTGEGTGLGLSMSYEIVTKVHGGTLDVSTVDGGGTSFTVRLPA